MKTLSEYELRAMCLGRDMKVFEVESDVFVTETAKEYLKERGIALRYVEKKAVNGQPMTKTKIPVHNQKAQYVDASSGEIYTEKPEMMTHLQGNLLVPKTHPRIFFRGKLDTLMAAIMRVEWLADAEQDTLTLRALEEVFAFVQQILSAEVNEKPLEDISLLGYDSDGLRYVTHHMEECFGVPHTVPSYQNGRLCIELNALRTMVRETELYAVSAFESDGTCTRLDIVEALNRLSSCVYIIYCRKMSERNSS